MQPPVVGAHDPQDPPPPLRTPSNQSPRPQKRPRLEEQGFRDQAQDLGVVGELGVEEEIGGNTDLRLGVVGGQLLLDMDPGAEEELEPADARCRSPTPSPAGTTRSLQPQTLTTSATTAVQCKDTSKNSSKDCTSNNSNNITRRLHSTCRNPLKTWRREGRTSRQGPGGAGEG